MKYSFNVFFRIFLHLLSSNLAYWLYGNGISYSDGNSFTGLYWWTNLKGPVTSEVFIYNWLASALPVTILSGAIGDRCSLTAFLICSLVLAGALQPLVVHWVWCRAGWLYQLGYTDYAGAGAIFIFAGASCFVSSFIVPYRKTEKCLLHSSQAYGIGILLIIIGFCSLNCGALYRISEYYIHLGRNLTGTLQNTILGGSGACLISLTINKTIYRRKTPRIQMNLATVNGAIAGIVSVSGAATYYSPWEALIVGLIGAVIYLQLHYLFLCLKIHDRSDGFPIYFGGGLWGVIAVDVFTQNGILFSSDFNNSLKNLLINILGGFSIFLWSSICTFTTLIILKGMGLLKIDNECEIKGLQFNGNQIMTEEEYIEALPYIIGDRREPDPLRNGVPTTINLYENLHSRKQLRLT